MPRGAGITSLQIKEFLEEIAKGATIAQAAEKVNATPGVFYARAQKGGAIYDELFAVKFAEAIEQRAAVRADKVDEKFDVWIEDPDRSDSLRLAWAKRWNPAYRDKQQVELTGGGGGAVRVTTEGVSLDDVAQILVAAGALPGDGGATARAALPAAGEVLAEPLSQD